MKLILMGTNDFVVPVFESLRKKHDILSVFTRAPKPTGRKQILTPSPVHVWAESHNIPVHTSIRDFDGMVADCVFVMSYGVIIPDDILSQSRFINIHPSNLPKYRGPSPIRTAIKNGDKTSAVCLMQMNHDLDAGDIYMCREFDIDLNDTNEIVENRVANISIEMLDEYFSNPNAFLPKKQIGMPTFTHKFTGADEIIDWKKTPIEIHNLVRALGAGRTKINGIDVKILKTTLENGNLQILELQPAGKRSMDWKSFVNGLQGADIKYGE
ncbi:MAG: methionyl-tRNA formyltransferase [Proteobacteria bacterium]|nr:methionyl-tRNA formyltransferase [Candidatus Enterousia onthequi]